MQNPFLDYIRRTSFSILLACISLTICCQQVDYPSVFGKDWEKANRYLEENRSWMEPLLRKNHVPFRIAAAVIFPELVRYSALRDKMEITLLKALYVNLGEEYANFSVGQFQIKPAFAASVSEKAKEVLGRRSGISFRDPLEFENISNYRKSIITDLEDPRTGFTYVVAFIKVCEKKYNLPRHEESRLIFLASAYNCGIDRDEQQISKLAGMKFFNTSLIPTSKTYSYADIALYWYRNY